jgi:hypothetical protein
MTVIGKEKAKTPPAISPFPYEPTLLPIHIERIKDNKEQLALKHFKDKPLIEDDHISINHTIQNPKSIELESTNILTTTSLDSKNQENSSKSMESLIMDKKN